MVPYQIAHNLRGLNLDYAEEILLVWGLTLMRRQYHNKAEWYDRCVDHFFTTEKGVREDDLENLNKALQLAGHPAIEFQESSWTDYMAMRGKPKIAARIKHLEDARTPQWADMVAKARIDATELPAPRIPSRPQASPADDRQQEIARRKAEALARAAAAGAFLQPPNDTGKAPDAGTTTALPAAAGLSATTSATGAGQENAAAPMATPSASVESLAATTPEATNPENANPAEDNPTEDNPAEAEPAESVGHSAAAHPATGQINQAQAAGLDQADIPAAGPSLEFSQALALIATQNAMITSLGNRLNLLENRIANLSEKIIDIHQTQRERRARPRYPYETAQFNRPAPELADAPQPDIGSVSFHFDDNKLSNPDHILVGPARAERPNRENTRIGTGDNQGGDSCADSITESDQNSGLQMAQSREHALESVT